MAITTQHLAKLEAIGLIRLAQTRPELEYLFRHALVQDAAYKSLLRQDRRQLHLRVGETLEQLYPENLEEIAPVLAQHFAAAGGAQRALKYFTLAGDVAAAVYANTEAVNHYTCALELAGQTETSRQNLTHLYTHLGRVLELNSQFEQALTVYQEMGKTARKHSDGLMELSALLGQATLCATFTPVYEPVRGQHLLEQALTLARTLDDQPVEAKILWNLAMLHIYTGRATQAVSFGEQSLALARQLNLGEQLALTLSDLGMIYWSTRQFDRAKEVLLEAKALLQELDNLPMLANCLSITCNVCLYMGKFEQAVANSQEAYKISKSIENLWGQSYSRYRVGFAYWEQGRPDQALTLMEESIRLSELAGFAAPQAITRADLAAVYGHLGQVEHGLEIAQQALVVAESQVPILRAYVLGILAQLHRLNNNFLEAETAIDRAKQDPNREAFPVYMIHVLLAEIELALAQSDYKRAGQVADDLLSDLRQMGMRAYLPKALYLKAQTLLGLKQREAAREQLLEARAEAEAIGSKWMLWQILAARSRLEIDPPVIDDLRQQAREIVEFIVSHAPADVWDSFVIMPQVRTILDD